MVVAVLDQSAIAEGLNDEQFLGFCILNYIWHSVSAFPFSATFMQGLYKSKCLKLKDICT